MCLASGGSSGVRGVFVQAVEEYTDFVASVVRPGWARMTEAGGPPPEGIVIGIIGAASPVHSTGFGAAISGPPIRLIAAPATLPMPEIVRRLNAAQPPALLGYPSKLAELAREQRAGRLRIAPRSVAALSELLTPRDRATIGEAFGVPVINQFASTEGLVGQSEPGGSVLRFASDLCLAELVDADNQPVPDGTASAKVLVTNLHNLTQPLIRYELTDRFVRPPGLPHGGYLRASVEGRADEPFRYGRLEVHPARAPQHAGHRGGGARVPGPADRARGRRGLRPGRRGRGPAWGRACAAGPAQLGLRRAAACRQAQVCDRGWSTRSSRRSPHRQGQALHYRSARRRAPGGRPADAACEIGEAEVEIGPLQAAVDLEDLAGDVAARRRGQVEDAAATSSGSPIRPSGVARSIWPRRASSVSTMSSAEVATEPTATALTLIRGARSAAARPV